jgi:antitoxin (DNA-binding transcriptional repressor) of toxin-antitoxin stability system
MTANMAIQSDHLAPYAHMADVLEISATEFKAKCLSLFKELEARRYQKVVVTRRGKAIAELTAAKGKAFDLYGCMKGSVIIPPWG